MGRRIQTTVFHATGQDAKIDGYFDRVIKYIPSDIVGAWIAITGFIPKETTDPNSGAILWLAFGIGLLLCAVWTAMQTREEGKPRATMQIVVSTSAFAVWVIALGRPFDSISGYHQYYGSLLLIAFTLVSGRLVPKD
ncbi:hypothetical protein HL667_01260 [Bradyrhizobium sp. 83012]|uniref:SPW repeat-containing protein n=1 Tax=Bradyrhizobium aeschynomenes TaxID=2734909 RepID=A0ABX2C5R6_9BRAD|nr:hypothetical protein [Bradyrhizobium aeschynomenes]NPU63621.1 hypothetical protein [Bradyrhizobium aeschynomenes]